MNPLVQQFFDVLDKFPQAVPDKIIQRYLGAARASKDQEALRQLTIFEEFLDTQVARNDTDKATVSLCKRIAERMVKAGIWPESVLGQFARWPPEANGVR